MTCPEKDLYFGEGYFARKPYSTGSVSVVPYGGGSSAAWTTIPSPGFGRKWVNTVMFGKTFAKPPDVEFSFYDPVLDRVCSPWVLLGSVHPFLRFYSRLNMYYVVRRDRMTVGLLIGITDEMPNQASYPYWTCYQTEYGKLNWVIWDEV